MSKRMYVKVENGVVAEGPFFISENGSDSPNTGWSKEQMKIHGFYEVIISPFDSVAQEVDYANPVVTDYSVFYPLITKPVANVLSNLKIAKINQLKDKAETIIFKKYPIFKQLSAALGLYPNAQTDVIKQKVKSIIDAQNIMESEINNLQTREEIENYQINYPVI